jgi:hypothetical protein
VLVAVVFICSENPVGVAEEGERAGVLPWYEARFHACLTCGAEVPLGSFTAHLRHQHRTAFATYRWDIKTRVPDPDSESGSGSRKAKKTHKRRKKLRIVMCFEVLDGLF